MNRFSLKLSALLVMGACFAGTSAYAETLFADDFNGPTLSPTWQPSLPDAPWRFGSRDASAIYQGAAAFSFQTLDGRSVIRLQNTLNNAQRRGWSSAASFPSDAPILYEARFNTEVQSRTTGIDQLLEIWILDSSNPGNYDTVALSAPEFGAARVFTATSVLTSMGVDAEFAFDNNTWYRLVIKGSTTEEVRASLYNDAGTVELIGVNLGHTMSAYGAGFKIGFSQSMGRPNAPFPTDVAIDSVRLISPPADDADGDGISDRKDECPHSDLSATVAIGSCDSGVPNPVLPSGCTIADLMTSCVGAAKGHGESGRCVSRLLDDLDKDRILSRPQEAAIQRCVPHR